MMSKDYFTLDDEGPEEEKIDRPIAVIEPMRGSRGARAARARSARLRPAAGASACYYSRVEGLPLFLTSRNSPAVAGPSIDDQGRAGQADANGKPPILTHDQSKQQSSAFTTTIGDSRKSSSTSTSASSQEVEITETNLQTRSTTSLGSRSTSRSSAEGTSTVVRASDSSHLRSVIESIYDTALPKHLSYKSRSMLPPKDQKMLDLMMSRRKADASQRRKSEMCRLLWEKERDERVELEKQQKVEYERHLASRRSAAAEEVRLRREQSALEDMAKQRGLLRSIKQKQEASLGALKKSEDMQDIETWKKIEAARMRAESAALHAMLREAREEARRDATRAALCARLDGAAENRCALRHSTLQKKAKIKQMYTRIHRNNVALCKMAESHYASALKAQIQQKEERMERMQEQKRKKLDMQRTVAQASATLREQVRNLKHSWMHKKMVDIVKTDILNRLDEGMKRTFGSEELKRGASSSPTRRASVPMEHSQKVFSQPIRKSVSTR